MKKITITLLSIIFLSIGCSEEFTDINPIGALSDSQLGNAVHSRHSLISGLVPSQNYGVCIPGE